MKRFLTIAGSDCSGGAGIQADMSVAVQHGLFPMSVVTALTAQAKDGVRNVLITPSDFVAEQLDAVFSDCVPDAIKIGMLGNREIVEVVTQKLNEYNAQNIVLDTVLVSSSGFRLLNNGGITVLKEKLIPLCNIITPNISEAEVLAEMKISGKADMERCAVKLTTICSNIIITGGHLSGNTCNDLLVTNGELTWFNGKKIKSGNTHGTGCAFSSTFACNLSLGHSLEESVEKAKEYVEKRIASDNN